SSPSTTTIGEHLLNLILTINNKMNTFINIFLLLLLTVSSYVAAKCSNTCDMSKPCNNIYNCLKDTCYDVTEEDLPSKCKCYVKCRFQFVNLETRPKNCLLLQKLWTCFKESKCDSSNVPELQLYRQDCNNCQPGKCQHNSCFKQMKCLTSSAEGGCASSTAVQKVLNTTGTPMHNAWHMAENCTCTSRCSWQFMRFVQSCVAQETLKKCLIMNNDVCSENIYKNWNMKPCECEFACAAELNLINTFNTKEEKCRAASKFKVCAKLYGCNEPVALIQNLQCSQENSAVLPSGLPIFTVLAAAVTAYFLELH
ncbi:uncharacterized protein LOC115232232, partial, partial [Argonauta hians]